MFKIKDILPNSLNPRKRFDEAGLNELAQSIEKHGLLQPMRVRTKGDKYEVVVGDRRLRAIRLLEMKEIPDDWIIVQGEKSNGQTILESLSENIQRGNLFYLETAEGIKNYREEWTKEHNGKEPSQQTLAKEFGKSQQWISSHLKIAGLDNSVKKKLLIMSISEYTVWNYLVPLNDTQKQLLLLDQIEKKNLSEAQIAKTYKEFKKTDLVTLLQTYKYLPETTHEIFNQDSTNMEILSDNSVHLVVTSPPYGDIKEYSFDKRDIGKYKDEEYLEKIEPVYKECYRVLQPGRKFCLNIKNEPRNGDSGVIWYPYAYKTLELCMKIGFEFADVIIWNKPNREGMQFGSLPYPGSPLVSDSIEYIFILRKPGQPDYKHLSNLAKEASVLSKEEYTNLINQVWTFPGQVKINQKGVSVEHLAPFPQDLPLKIIKIYSYISETILDPFLGWGTTAVAAKKLGRNSAGFELKKKYIELAKEQLSRVI